MKMFLVLFFSFFGAVLFAKDYQITYEKQEPGSHEITLDLLNYQVDIVEKAGSVYSKIRFGSSVFLQKKGFAELPFVHATIQLPPLRNVDLLIEGVNYEDVDLRYPLLPSRGVIYRHQNPDTIPYKIAPESVVDSWYPDSVVSKTRPFILKDVRGITVYFYPFQYNAVQKRLRVYQQIKITLKENDSRPINPLVRNPEFKILPEMDGIYQSTFLNYTRSQQDLDYGQHGDILVITTDRDTSAIAPYINWKREKGFNVSREIVPAGTNVKDLIQQKYDENNNLLYVQLVGDWNEIQSDKGTSENGPMDPQLGCVAGDDNYADISVGRFSAESSQQVTVQVNKIINYEKSPEAGANWYKTATGIGSAEGSGSGDDGEMDKDHIQIIWGDKLDPFTYDYYHDVYDPGATSAMVSDAVNSGTGIINYCGHGSMTSWGTSGFSNSDVQNLTNGSMLPFIFSVACVNGAFDDGECFAEAWLHKENGGAVMFLGSTINQPWQPPMRGQDYFNDILIGGYNYDEHSGQNGINTHEQRTFIGSIVINGFALMLNESNSSSDLETVETWCIFGDPSMQVRTDLPANLEISNTTITAGSPYSTQVTSNGQAVEDAMVCISQSGRYFSGLTDANGEVTIDHDFENGTALLVVTAFNKETIYSDVEVSGGDGPHVVVYSYTVNDTGVGNGNGEIEYQEQFYLNVSARNIGNQIAVDVESQISTDDPYIELLDSLYFYGTIDTSEIIPGPQAFLLKAKDGVPDQHSATCEVTFSDTSAKKWTSTINLTVNAPDLDNGGLTIDDSEQGDGNNVLDAGETAAFIIPAFNQGHATAVNGTATLTTTNPYLTVQEGSFSAGDLAAGDTIDCTFQVSASSDAPDGERAELYFDFVAGAYSCQDTFTINIGGKVVYLMQNGTYYVTDGLFYDSGGKDANYSTNEEYTMTFYPADRSPAVKAVFNSFQTTANYDRLYIYDGPDKTYPQVSGSPFSGDNSPGEIVATNSAGALTFYFTSNPILADAGWDADIFSTGISEIAGSRQRSVTSFKLFSAYPNPFNPETHIRYQLPERSEVRVAIYDVLGREVRTLFNGWQNQGEFSLVWDGKSNTAEQLSSGIYICHIKAGKYSAKQKLLLIR